MRKLALWSAVMSLFATLLASVPLGVEARQKTSKPLVAETEGPRVEVPAEELEKDTQGDEEGLKRLGNFGRFHFFVIDR